jgi:hypothetical protein
MVIYDNTVDGEEYAARCGLVNGDVFMVFQFCEYDLYGILRNNDVVSRVPVKIERVVDFCNGYLCALSRF